MDRKYLILLFLLINVAARGQQIRPFAEFAKDSIQIGEEVPYTLWVRYPRSQDVIFPDSLYNFSPFEIVKRDYFTTKTDSTESLDSVIYYLSTFEIDTVQYLQLPIYLVNEFDSIELRSNLDSIILQHVVTTIPDSVSVLVNTEYQKVPLAFNYPYFTAGIIILIIVGVIIFIVFGGKIKRAIQVYWISRRHKKFLAGFRDQINAQEIAVEKTLGSWKVYLEKLESKPFTKLTTKEIVGLTKDQDIKNGLSTIDRYIYAVNDKPDTSESFEQLLTFAIARYQLRIKEVKHG